MAASKERTKGIHQWWHLIDLAEALVERMTPWNTKYKLVSWRAFASSAWIRFSCFSLIFISFSSSLGPGLLSFPGSWPRLLMLTLCLSLSNTQTQTQRNFEGSNAWEVIFIAKLSYHFRHQSWWVGQKEWSNLIQ